MANDFKELTHAEMQAVYKQNLKDFKELTDDARRAELQEILAEMDVPNMRRLLNKFSNLSWLKRNLLINNSNHPRAQEALEIIRIMMHEWTRG